VIEVVVGEVVDGDALRRQPVPAIEFPRKQREHRTGLVMREVVAPDLAVIVSEAARILRRRRQ
jgi:hypothetical protein